MSKPQQVQVVCTTCDGIGIVFQWMSPDVNIEMWPSAPNQRCWSCEGRGVVWIPIPIVRFSEPPG